MPCFQLSMGVWASNCVLIQLRTYGLRTDGLLEETNAHASKTDTFITCNSFRVHSSRLPKLEYLPRNGAGANQSSAVCTYFLCYQNLNLPRNGGCQPIKMRTVHVHARTYVFGTKFEQSLVECAMPVLAGERSSRHHAEPPSVYICRDSWGVSNELLKVAIRTNC